MKQVPLNQPHGTLVSLGIQTVVTSNHRIEPGTRIEVKANKRKPRLRWNHKDGRSPVDAVLDHVAMGAYFEAIEGDDWWCYEWTGPLGVVVCTAVVTDCLPIVEMTDGSRVVESPTARLHDHISDQLPYCDWTSTRKCPRCKGHGFINGRSYPTDYGTGVEYDADSCPRCNGSGLVQRWVWLLADIEHDIECPVCEGVMRRGCVPCGGSGRVALPLDPKEMP